MSHAPPFTQSGDTGPTPLLGSVILDGSCGRGHLPEQMASRVPCGQ